MNNVFILDQDRDIPVLKLREILESNDIDCFISNNSSGENICR